MGCTKLRNEIGTQRTKRNERKRNITQRNILKCDTKRNETKYTKIRNATKYTKMQKRNETILKSNKNNMNGTRSDEKVEAECYTDMHV